MLTHRFFLINLDNNACCFFILTLIDKFDDKAEKEKAQKVFIDIAAAKEVLSDPGKHRKLLIVCHLSILRFLLNKYRFS